MGWAMTAELVFWLVLAHFIGDYFLQSDWMAQGKTEKWWPAIAHGLTYGIPFAIILLVTFGWVLPVGLALLIIVGTHTLIDHYRWAKQIGWLKNQFAPKRTRYSWEEGKANAGYSANTPVWLSTWLMIITDNVIHIVINFLAVTLLLGTT